jgi:hypothetical protein
MSAAATVRGVEVLRREINAAAMTDTTESMKNIKVVIADVGFVGSSVAQSLVPQGVHRTMEDWTPSEKVAYGPAFSSILEEGNQYGVPRKATDVSTFVNSIIEIVSGGRKGKGWAITLYLGVGKFRNWVRGERFAVGAGGKRHAPSFDRVNSLCITAHTYTYASYLPSKVLNLLLGIPHFLISIRNSILGSAVVQPTLPPPGPVVPPPAVATAPPAAEVNKVAEELSEHEASEAGSEADVESNSSGHDGVESSWIKA